MKKVLSEFKKNILNKNLNINIIRKKEKNINKNKNKNKNKKVSINTNKNKKINLNNINRKKRKKKYLCLNVFNMFLLVCLFMILLNQISFAYWYVIINPNSAINQHTVSIGKWIFNSIIYDPDNLVYISSGTYVLRDMPDGTQRIFYAQRNIPTNDQYHDPLNPSTSWLVPVRYLDCSGNWQRYHTYNRRDLTIFNGQVYEYTYRIAHTANTVTAKSPAEEPSRWSLRTDLTPDSNAYIRYKVYMEGAVVNYKNSNYQCIVDATVNVEPKNSSPNWTMI